MEIQVMVYFPTGITESAVLSYSEEKTRIILDNGKEFQEDLYNSDSEFSIRNEVNGIPISVGERIALKSFSVIRRYSHSPASQYEMYPASTNGWVTQLSNSGTEAIFFIHNMIGNSKYLMLILDYKSRTLLDAQKINPYEVNILLMERNWDAYRKLYAEMDIQSRDDLINRILDTPPPTWNELALLVQGVNVPNLSLKRTMRETVDQLVPNSFPENIRDELIAFLSLILRIEIPKEDPLVFNARYRSTPLLVSLLFHHIQCLIEGDKPPQYVRVFTMADRKSLQEGLEPTVDVIENNPWDIAWYKLVTMFPNHRGRIFQVASTLNQNQEIITGIPITKKDAANSRKAWIDRFAMILYSLQLRGHVINQKLGLRTLVYVGGAHRWPHKHLSWSARLGYPAEKPPYIQVMVMPPSATERILRMRTNISEIIWSASKVNYNLFNESTQSWNISTSRIMKSIESQRSLKQLEREFSLKGDAETHMPDREESKVLGFITWAIYLNSLELGEYDKCLGMNRSKLGEILTKLSSKGIIQIHYYLPMTGLASICLVCKGDSNRIHSLSRAFMKHTPSTTAMISDSGNSSFILARMPEDSVYDISTQLPKRSREFEMDIKVYRVNAYAAYTHNLYERLLRPDQTWDDDISGLLSQIRT